MPFTIGGEWIPSEKEEDKHHTGKPVKVRLEKRGNKKVTVVLNLNKGPEDARNLATQLKRVCGCGGTIKEGIIEIQGDRVDQVRSELRRLGVKAQ